MSVESARRGRRNPLLIRGSGRPVMKNLTFEISLTNLAKTERIADDGSSSLHSSSASITMTVEIPVSRSGSTISFCIWLHSDSCIMSGFDRSIDTKRDRKSGYLCASWNAMVGNMKWRLLRSSKSREQKNEAPRRPSDRKSVV